MAGESKQIYQLTNGTFNGSSLVPFEVPNTDTSTSAERPYITRKTTGDEVSEFVAKTQEFETDLQTDDKTIIGAINELKEGGGGNANYVELTQAEYDELTEEEKHNGKMYFITDGGSDGSIIDDETTSTETTWSSQKINDELSPKQNSTDNALTTTAKTVVGAINEVKGTVATKQDNMAKGQITNTNLNTLNTNGNYYLAGVSSANNAPTNDFWGMLEVISSVIIIQRATQVGTSGVGNNVYERLFISNNWTAWKKIVRTFS